MSHTQRHEVEVTKTYHVIDYKGNVEIVDRLKEARELYVKAKEETGVAMIYKETIKKITLEDFEYIQGGGHWRSK